MSWLRIAAGFLRDAMTSSSESPEPVQEMPPPENITEIMGIVNRHRFEIDKNFEAVVEMLNAQKARHLKALQIQRRWNYGLASALLLVIVSLAIAIYWRR